MTYTYRHKSTGARVAIVASETVQGYKIVYAQREYSQDRRLWYWPTFQRWHEIISPAVVETTPPVIAQQPHKPQRCACGNSAVVDMTLSTKSGATIYHLCAECAELERSG